MVSSSKLVSFISTGGRGGGIYGTRVLDGEARKRAWALKAFTANKWKLGYLTGGNRSVTLLGDILAGIKPEIVMLQEKLKKRKGKRMWKTCTLLVSPLFLYLFLCFLVFSEIHIMDRWDETISLHYGYDLEIRIRGG